MCVVFCMSEFIVMDSTFTKPINVLTEGKTFRDLTNLAAPLNFLHFFFFFSKTEISIVVSQKPMSYFTWLVFL